MTHEPDFLSLLEIFFMKYLMQQRQASPHTISSYRDTFRLLVRYAARELGKAPEKLALGDFDSAFVGDFLQHLEEERGNDARTRNNRLAAIRSFFRIVALHEPHHGARAQRILAIPSKRYDRRTVNYLDQNEIDALLEAPNLGTWIGRRDRTLLVVAIQTGLRASELIQLRCKDVELGTGAHVRCRGKGRKARSTPLRKDSVAALGDWLKELNGRSKAPVFPSQRGGLLSHDSLSYLVAKHAATTRARGTALQGKHVTPHTLRHTAAMQLHQRGVARTIIALWLGHETVDTTYIYLHANMKLKEQAMAKATETGVPPSRFQPEDKLLAFLSTL